MQPKQPAVRVEPLIFNHDKARLRSIPDVSLEELDTLPRPSRCLRAVYRIRLSNNLGTTVMRAVLVVGTRDTSGSLGTWTGKADTTDASSSTRISGLTGRMGFYEHGMGCF